MLCVVLWEISDENGIAVGYGENFEGCCGQSYERSTKDSMSLVSNTDAELCGKQEDTIGCMLCFVLWKVSSENHRGVDSRDVGGVLFSIVQTKYKG